MWIHINFQLLNNLANITQTFKMKFFSHFGWFFYLFFCLFFGHICDDAVVHEIERIERRIEKMKKELKIKLLKLKQKKA